jgi:hypothetical protein
MVKRYELIYYYHTKKAGTPSVGKQMKPPLCDLNYTMLLAFLNLFDCVIVS